MGVVKEKRNDGYALRLHSIEWIDSMNANETDIHCG